MTQIIVLNRSVAGDVAESGTFKSENIDGSTQSMNCRLSGIGEL